MCVFKAIVYVFFICVNVIHPVISYCQLLYFNNIVVSDVYAYLIIKKMRENSYFCLFNFISKHAQFNSFNNHDCIIIS